MFVVTHPVHGEIIWNEGFVGNGAIYDVLMEFIDEGEYIRTVPMGVEPKAGDQPEWVAWYTARTAMEDNLVPGLIWSDTPESVIGLFDIPDDAVA